MAGLCPIGTISSEISGMGLEMSLAFASSTFAFSEDGEDSGKSGTLTS